MKLNFEVEDLNNSGVSGDSQCFALGNRLRPAVDVEFAIDVAGVGFDCRKRDG